ncbi:MAG: DUF484 family protein [Candidatus Protistobacter heckmanni]|nr:DUF484 family protein [Candidatus Protistobacter heckmanni]
MPSQEDQFDKLARMNPNFDEAGLAAWLHDHPDFFERQADLLASLQLKSPHGQRAVSLQERQLEILRDKNRSRELRLADLLRHGHENDRTLTRMRGWLMGMLSVADAAKLSDAITQGLQQAFDLPCVALRVWEGPQATAKPQDLRQRPAAALLRREHRL